ncbi:hypothetical protein [Streptomyces puniciscabiei]
MSAVRGHRRYSTDPELAFDPAPYVRWSGGYDRPMFRALVGS